MSDKQVASAPEDPHDDEKKDLNVQDTGGFIFEHEIEEDAPANANGRIHLVGNINFPMTGSLGVGKGAGHVTGGAASGVCGPGMYATFLPYGGIPAKFLFEADERAQLGKSFEEYYHEKQEKKKAEERMVQKAESRYAEEPAPEVSDRVYKVPYASGGPVGHPRVSTAIHGLFYALWVFALWVTQKPAMFVVAVAKTIWKVPVAISRGIKHACLVVLPPVTLLGLSLACLTGPRWVEPLMNWGGWGYDRHGDWGGFGISFFLAILVALIWNIFHVAYRLVEGEWWWKEKK